MPAIQCPNCSSALEYDPAQAGMAATCPHCQAPFKVPQPRASAQWAPPPIVVASHGRREPSWWAKIHWTKKGILIATLLWPVSCIGCGAMTIANRVEQPREERLEYNHQSGEVNKVITHHASVVALVFGDCMFITAIYMFSLFFLIVLWFATHP
jgi:hypothetical protein